MSQPWTKIVPAEQIDEALVAGFSCGDDVMDDWFLSKALNWCYLGFCQVYVAVDDDDVACFKKLQELGVELEIKRVPDTPTESIDKLFK